MNGPIDLSDVVSQYRKTRIRVVPMNSNRASALGQSCTRRIVYERTAWDKKKLHDEGLQAIFDGGNWIEEMVIADLKKSGIVTVQQQRDLALPAYEITGHIDCAIQIEGYAVPIPLDVKSMSPFIFAKIKTPNDFFDSKYEHLKSYPSQVLLYGYMMAADYAVLYCIDKSTFKTKDFWFKIADYMDVIESLKEKASTVTQHVRAGTLPDRIDDSAVCERCPFSHVCLPDRDFGPGAIVFDDAELRAMLDRWHETKAVADEHDSLDEDIKEIAKSSHAITRPAPGQNAPMDDAAHRHEIARSRPQGKTDGRDREILVGPYVLKVQNRVRKEWVVDDNTKKMIGEIKETPYQVVKIERR